MKLKLIILPIVASATFVSGCAAGSSYSDVSGQLPIDQIEMDNIRSGEEQSAAALATASANAAAIAGQAAADAAAAQQAMNQ